MWEGVDGADSGIGLSAGSCCQRNGVDRSGSMYSLKGEYKTYVAAKNIKEHQRTTNQVDQLGSIILTQYTPQRISIKQTKKTTSQLKLMNLKPKMK